METSPLGELLGQLCHELGPALGGADVVGPGACRAKAVIPFHLERGEDGKAGLFVGGPASAGSSTPGFLSLEVEFEGNRNAPRPQTSPAEFREARAPQGTRESVVVQEPTEGGTSATLHRRLEILLGGPPGFNTGAKAAILADLLREFGRPALLEALRGAWIREFDTGPEASASMSQRPF